VAASFHELQKRVYNQLCLDTQILHTKAYILQASSDWEGTHQWDA